MIIRSKFCAYHPAAAPNPKQTRVPKELVPLFLCWSSPGVFLVQNSKLIIIIVKNFLRTLELQTEKLTHLVIVKEYLLVKYKCILTLNSLALANNV